MTQKKITLMTPLSLEDINKTEIIPVVRTDFSPELRNRRITLLDLEQVIAPLATNNIAGKVIIGDGLSIQDGIVSTNIVGSGGLKNISSYELVLGGSLSDGITMIGDILDSPALIFTKNSLNNEITLSSNTSGKIASQNFKTTDLSSSIESIISEDGIEKVRFILDGFGASFKKYNDTVIPITYNIPNYYSPVETVKTLAISVNGVFADEFGNIEASMGGNFIPLSGTIVGSPVTGNIESTSNIKIIEGNIPLIELINLPPSGPPIHRGLIRLRDTSNPNDYFDIWNTGGFSRYVASYGSTATFVLPSIAPPTYKTLAVSVNGIYAGLDGNISVPSVSNYSFHTGLEEYSSGQVRIGGVTNNPIQLSGNGLSNAIFENFLTFIITTARSGVSPKASKLELADISYARLSSMGDNSSYGSIAISCQDIVGGNTSPSFIELNISDSSASKGIKIFTTHIEVDNGFSEYVDDAAAALGNIPINGLYRTGSILKIRVV